MKMIVTKTKYTIENGTVYVIFMGRGEDGERKEIKVRGPPPYFYSIEKPMNDSMIVRSEKYGVTIDGISLYRNYVRYPKDIPQIRDKYTHFEADIRYSDRVRIDHKIKYAIEYPDDKDELTMDDIRSIELNIKPTYAIIDIEVRDDVEFAKPNNPTQQILSISIYDSDKGIIYHGISANDRNVSDIHFSNIGEFISKYMGEKVEIKIKVLKDEFEIFRFIDNYLKVRKPDIITGWNITNYDIDYIINRGKQIGYHIDFSDYVIFDAMIGYDILHEGELGSKSLEYCANEVLGIGKVKHSDYKNLYDLYLNNIDKFIAYNIIDVVLVDKILKARGIIDYFWSISKLSGVEMDRTKSSMPIVETYIMFYLSGKGIVLPSKSERLVDKPKGAYVHEPAKGIYNYVIVLDLAQEYPSIMRTFNISPDTIVHGDDYDFEINGVRFTNKRRGIIPAILDTLVNERKKLKLLMNDYPQDSSEYNKLYEQQRALKYLINSFYGVLGNKYFRLANSDVAGAVTYVGREHAKWNIKVIEEAGYKVLYGDTDSTMVLTGADNVDDAVSIGIELQKKLNNSYMEFARQFGYVDEHYFSIKLEKVYKKWLQPGVKKRYAGWVVWKDGKYIDEDKHKFDIKGFEIRRSNAAEITKEIQMKVIELLLTNGVDAMSDYLRDIYHKVKKGDIEIEMLGIPTGYNSTEANSIHVRAVRNSEKLYGIEFMRGDKIRYYFTKMSGYDVIAFKRDDKVPDDVKEVIDLDRHIDRTIISPIKPILEVVGMENFFSSIGSKSLFDFM